MRFWIGVIMLSSVVFMAVAHATSQYGLRNARLQQPGALDLSPAEIAEKARRCAEEKRQALRTNDTNRYIELVTDLSCHRAEFLVSGG